MKPAPPLPPAAAALALALALLLCLSLSPAADAHNITHILAKHPEFSTFNHYLTVTHLAAEINRRLTITVLAVDNGAMSAILDKHLSIGTLKNLLSLHVLVDYFGTKKLHQISSGTTLTSTMFQATGTAAGTSGYINITDLKGGKVGFGAEDNGGDLNAVFVKSVDEIPYNISVLQISQVLTSPEAEAPTASPSDLNITAILSKQGCKSFADLISASGALKTFDDNLEGGLTIFCASDAVLSAFMPKYKNLTAARKLSLLLYHGVPVYQSLQMLKSNNGAMNTLATDGASKFDFTVQNDGEDVKLETKVVTATITATVIDQDPLIVYKIDKVLQPRELFKASAADAPAPAPKGSTKKKKKKESEADAPEADSPDGDPADQTADSNGVGGGGLSGVRVVVGVVLSLCLSVVFL
ncbi:fasciclin-like arabinogalactan protein 2 [Syzygium oleosum]|uniref:fasciclin-like arabinogalactan protein 2 n=1 Tax=Syzygium oleosum TaxID=219896 RepID=UPI0024B8F7C1|nr:fasciclin-like arabinogalactan protein 2 [Syzygium oleosum]